MTKLLQRIDILKLVSFNEYGSSVTGIIKKIQVNIRLDLKISTEIQMEFLSNPAIERGPLKAQTKP